MESPFPKLSLALRRLRPQPAVVEPNGIPSDEGVAVPPRVVAANRNYAFVEKQLVAEKLYIAASVLLAIVLFAAMQKAEKKPSLYVEAPQNLRQLAEDYFKADSIRFDQIAITINAVLPYLHYAATDENGSLSPFLPVLQGVVAPSVIKEAQDGLQKSGPEIQRTRTIQTLHIRSIGDFETDDKLGRVSCYVRGFVQVVYHKTGQIKTIPYRGEILLERNTVGALNPLPFTVIKRTERFGEAAAAWDRERAAKKKKD